MTVARGNINTYLIIGGRAAERESHFNQSFAPGRRGIDLFVLDVLEKHKSIGITQILDLQKIINLKAWGNNPQKVFVLRAELLTEEAQNSLLKILEEPPKGVVFILSAPTANHLLPTVVSRCLIIDLRTAAQNHEAQKDGETKIATDLISRGRGERLLWVEAHPEYYQNRDQLIELLDSFTVYLRKLLLDESKISKRSDLPESPFQKGPTFEGNGVPVKSKIHSFPIVQAIYSLMETKKIITDTNASPRLALEVFLLNLSIIKG